MTEELANENETVVSSDSEPKAAPDDDMQKPVFNKIQMQDVVSREKQKAFERGKREALMELQQQQAQGQAQSEQQATAQQIQPQSQGLGGMAPQLNQADIERMIAEKAPQALQSHVNQLKQEHMINSFVTKMQAAEQLHPGLEQKLGKLNYQDPAMHSLIEMANNLENTGDVMKELLDNPSKMIQVLGGIKEQPFLAQETLSSLSNSIKQNQAAAAENTQSRDPMSQLKPSTSAGLADANSVSVMDLRKMLSRKK